MLNSQDHQGFKTLRLLKNIKIFSFNVAVIGILLFSICSGLNQIQASQSFNDRQPQVSISIITPQSFRIPTNQLQKQASDQNLLQQNVVLINNAYDDHEDDRLRLKYRKLSLQLRDAKSPITGQLFFEHVFDYFSKGQKTLLIPVNLDQVSPTTTSLHAPATSNGNNRTNYEFITKPQQLIVSIRPHQLENAGFASDSIEFASSAPIPVEPVPSFDGSHSFTIVQTDKPIYKPSEKVKIRSLIVNEYLRPIVNDEMKIQVKNPHRVIVEEVKFPRPNKGEESKNEPLFLDHVFEFPPEPMLGLWSVHLLHNDPIANDTISFEVREYVLPTFEIEFESPKYILPTTQNITGSIVAKYHYGKPVQGKAQFKYGYKESGNSKPRFFARSGIKTIDPQTGRVEYKINTSEYQKTSDWYPSIAGSKFFIEATVTEMTTGHREIAQDSSCTFITYPYRISFEDSIEDFKPGLSQKLTVQVMEMQTLQAGPKGVKLVASYWDQNGTALVQSPSSSINKLDYEAITDQDGKASFNIGPLNQDITTIQVTVKWIHDSSNQMRTTTTVSPSATVTQRKYNNNELAVGMHSLVQHESLNGWISIINKSSTSVSIFDEFKSDVLIKDAIVRPEEIYYIIVSRGQIVDLKSLDEDGFIRFKVIEVMAPTMRLVLFARTTNDIILSDSMKINVKNHLDCGMKLTYLSALTNIETTTMRPNDKGKLVISGTRRGDLISLIGVDSAVYSLNNRSKLESSRLVERIKRLDSGCGFGGGRDDLDVFHNAGLMITNNFPSQEQKSQQTNYLGSSCMTVLNQLKSLEDIQLGYSKPMFSLTAASASLRPRILDIATSVRQRNYGPYSSVAANSYYQSPSRSVLRNKREEPADAIEELVKRYKDPFSKSCCRLGTLEDSPQMRDCSTRARIVERYTGGRSCSAIYLDCCRAINKENLLFSGLGFTGRSVVESMATSRLMGKQHGAPNEMPPNVGHLDQIEQSTLIRKDFRETWLFELVQVEGSDLATINTTSIDVQLPHSITSWSIQALSLNRHAPMCIMPKPFKLVTFQEIFIQLTMPYKVIQGEQIDLIATIFNYSPMQQEIFVYMYGVENVCSDAESGERSERKRLRIDKHSSQAVLFPIIPLKIGKYPIKLVALNVDMSSSDIVEQELNVVPRGRPVSDEMTFSLDPMNYQKRSKRAIQTGNLLDEIDSSKGLQIIKVRLTPSRDTEFIVPGTQECIISAIGDKLGQTVQTSLIDVENLIRLPHGCGEQVMIYLGPTLYTTRYLYSINKLTGDLRWKALRYIQSGYKRILNYRKESGAFSAFARREPSIWLTAFIAKMLCQTEKTPFIANEIHVDKTVINLALNYLLELQNKDTGAWLELNPIYHREMLGGILRENALTAFITITLNECAHHSLDLIEDDNPNQSGTDRLKLAIQRAEKMLSLAKYKAYKEKNPYILALSAYALSFSKPMEAIETLNELLSLADRSQSRNHLYWRGDYSIETAAYALQAIIELAPLLNSKAAASPSGHMNFNDAISITNWLTSQKSYSGAFESTQDTIVALEALSKFAQLQSSTNSFDPLSSSASGGLMQQIDLVCNVTTTASNRTRRSISFDNENAQILQTFKLDSFDLDLGQSLEMIDIITSGNGLGTMSVKLKYNVYQDEDELCRINIDSTIEEWRPPKSSPIKVSKDLVMEDQSISNKQHNEGEPARTAATLGSNLANEEDYFKSFDKSMLSELNLIDLNQLDSSSNGTQAQSKVVKRNQVLRVRRSEPKAPILDLSANKNDNQTDGWASRIVTAIKKNSLTNWIQAKANGMTTTRKPVDSGITTSERVIRVEDSGIWRKTNTTRRSAQSTPVPLIVYPSGVPADAKLNPLSKQLDNTNETLAGNVTYQLQQSSLNQLNNKLILLLKVCVHHMYAKRDSEMAVIEIGILSGFKPNEADLKEITSKVGTLAMKIDLSADKSLVIIYMEYIPSSGPYCLQFRLIRDSLVYNLQSGYIRAYEYYSPTHSCSNIYTPSRVSNLIETKCDSSGQVCQCAANKLCPATNKLIDLGEIYSINATSARNQLMDLVCSSAKFDLVALVKLQTVRFVESGKFYKLSVKVKSDLRGNLTKIIDLQKQQKLKLSNGIRKPLHLSTTNYSNDSLIITDNEPDEDDTSLDYLNLAIDSSCIRDDPMLLHLAHPNQWKKGGDLMILFANSNRIEKRYFKVTQKPNGKPVSQQQQRLANFPTPKPNIISGLKLENENNRLHFEDAQLLLYSSSIQLDRDSIFHDITYQAKLEPREAINNLILWLELRSRRERWSCPT